MSLKVDQIDILKFFRVQNFFNESEEKKNEWIDLELEKMTQKDSFSIWFGKIRKFFVLC